MARSPSFAATDAPILEIKDLDVYYGRAHALQGVSFTLPRGVLAVVGRNGMGKTTLCNAIMGLVPATGSVKLAGEEIRGMPPNRITDKGGYDAARRLIDANHARITEVWTYRAANDGFDLVRMYADPSVANSKGASRVTATIPAPKPVAAPTPAPAPAPAKAPSGPAKAAKPAAKAASKPAPKVQKPAAKVAKASKPGASAKPAKIQASSRKVAKPAARSSRPVKSPAKGKKGPAGRKGR